MAVFKHLCDQVDVITDPHITSLGIFRGRHPRFRFQEVPFAEDDPEFLIPGSIF